MPTQSHGGTPHRDDELVLEAQQGNAEAFGLLMRRHLASSFQVALSILRNPADAEDEVQNAYWKAFQHIGSFQREAKFSTWITRIVMNQCLMRLRQQRRAQFVYLDEAVPDGERPAVSLPDPAWSPEEESAQREAGQVLEQEMGRIPPLLRHALVLREIEEMSMPEIAAQLGVSVAAAKSRLLRARAELRTRLQRHFPIPAMG